MERFGRTCNAYLDRFDACEAAVGGGRASESARNEIAHRIDALSHGLARDLLTEVPACGGTRAAAALLHRHPLHSRVVLQSAVMRHALVKPHGYAGDMDLMLMLCDGVPRGGTPFARAVNDVFVRVPAAQAVRDRVAMLAQLLDRLPDGAKVLNLACGPALEVQQLLASHPDMQVQVDLVDHDPRTLAYLRSRFPRSRVRLYRGNAFRILSGNLTVTPVGADPAEITRLTGGYDLIYSAGLYDYIPGAVDGVGGAPQLTQVLFSLLTPGGVLLVGNYLKPTPASAHQAHVQAMMELYSEWYLLYRSIDEIAGFASTIDAHHTINLIDENGQPLESSPGAVVGFTAIQAA